MTLSTAAFSQDQTLEKAVILSGGESEFAPPFSNFASIGYYNPASGNYTFQDSIYSQNVQKGFIRQNTVTFGAQDSIIQYDIENQERVKQFSFPQVSSVAGGEGRLAVGNFSLGINPDFPFVSFFDTTDFSPIDTIPSDSLGGGEDVAFVNDKAYAGFNITKANSRTDSIGRVAVYNFSTGSREANIDLGSQGAGISKVFIYNNQVYAVCEEQGQLATIDPQTGAVSYQPLDFSGIIRGPLNDRLYTINSNREVVFFDLQSGSTNATGITVDEADLGQFGGINAFNYDTINQQAYVGLTDFSDTGYVEVYDASGKIDSFETNVSTANILLDYDAFSADGGTVTTEGGADTAYACIDGQPDIVSFDSNTSADGKYRYVITDEDENILQVKAEDQQNFEPAGTGTCYVYGVSFSGSLQNTSSGTPLSDLSATSSLDQSANRITVIRDTLDGGRVEVAGTGNDTANVTINDSASVVQFSNTSATQELNYTYVVTNSQDTILNGNAGTSQDFNGAGTGTCYVYGFAHAGSLTATPDSSISSVTAEQCIDQSENRITVIRDSATVGLADEQGFQAQARVFPNPAETEINVELETAQGGEALITVRNLSGKLVRRKQAALEAGVNQLSLSLNEGRQGMYLIAIQQDDKRYSTKVLVK
jgi:hypothetical protein